MDLLGVGIFLANLFLLGLEEWAASAGDGVGRERETEVG